MLSINPPPPCASPSPMAFSAAVATPPPPSNLWASPESFFELSCSSSSSSPSLSLRANGSRPSVRRFHNSPHSYLRSSGSWGSICKTKLQNVVNNSGHANQKCLCGYACILPHRTQYQEEFKAAELLTIINNRLAFDDVVFPPQYRIAKRGKYSQSKTVKVFGESRCQNQGEKSTSCVDLNLLSVPESTMALKTNWPALEGIETCSSVMETGDLVFVSSSDFLQQTKERRKVVRTAWEALVRWSRSWRLLNARRNANVLQKTKKVVVLGGGSFGTAMAVLLAKNKPEMLVSILARDISLCQSINTSHINRKYFPNHKLPKNILATVNAKEALGGAEFCIHAVPVQYSAEFLKSISQHVPPNLPFCSVSKGLELSSLEMMSQVIPRALGNPRQPVAVISGPSFAIELMDELPTAMVAASKDKELARAAQQLMASHYLRINTSSDVVGVEIAGALKNVLAIAAGIVEGMNLGNNCMAALVAQGCSEIRWLAEKMGAKSATLAGLAGTGDIMLTCFVKLSRNRGVGVRIGSGESLDHILSSMNQVAEGVATAGAVVALARKYRVQMPVLTAVARILENELTPKKAVLELMSLPQVEEV